VLGQGSPGGLVPEGFDPQAPPRSAKAGTSLFLFKVTHMGIHRKQDERAIHAIWLCPCPDSLWSWWLAL